MAALAAPRARAPPAHRPPRRRRARSCASAPAGGGAEAAAAAKRALRAALEGVESFGLFGCGSPQAREDIEAAAAALEALCTHEEPASPAVVEAVVAGEWRVLFSTVTILGSRRTKLGLRGGVVTVDSLSQRIDPAAAVAENVVHFSLAGLGAAARGTLAVRARYSQAAARRVAIEYEASELQPEALERVLGANMDLLLKIFNPEGWLDISFVDDEMRLGRDDKGNLYVLERVAAA